MCIDPTKGAQQPGGQDVSTLPPVGAGGYVSRDGQPHTGEFLWRGSLPAPVAYYIRVHNDTPMDIDCWLFTDDVIRVALGSAATERSQVDVEHPQPPATQWSAWHVSVACVTHCDQ